MLTLTTEEKSDLKDLLKKPGYKVMQKIAADFEIDVLRMFKGKDVAKAENLAILSKNVSYLKGVEDFMLTISSGTNNISERKKED